QCPAAAAPRRAEYLDQHDDLHRAAARHPAERRHRRRDDLRPAGPRPPRPDRGAEPRLSRHPGRRADRLGRLCPGQSRDRSRLWPGRSPGSRPMSGASVAALPARPRGHHLAMLRYLVRHSPLAVALVALFLLTAIFGPALAPYSITDTDLSIALQNP